MALYLSLSPASQVVPAPLLGLFTASELQHLLGGCDPHVDDYTLRQWRSATTYEIEAHYEAAPNLEAGEEATLGLAGSSRREAFGAVFGAGHATARGVWECLARASGTERAAVWRFATGRDAPPPRHCFSSGGGGGDDSPPFTLALRGPRSARHPVDAAARGISGSNSSSGISSISGSTSGGLFTASTCFRTLYAPNEPFDSVAELAAALAESVAAGMHPALAAHGGDGGFGSGEAGFDDFAEAQRRLRAAVGAAAARVADSAARGGGGAEASADPLAMRSLFPNSYQCPRCGCGPIDHAACDNLKTHHGERRAGVKVSNACPGCGWYSPELSAWKPWDGTFQ
jgi:hypothetical protein